jgi:hypothetical protein
MEYTFRPMIFEKQKTFSLCGDHMEISGEGIKTSIIPYESILSVNLAHTPNRYKTNVFTTMITTKDRREFRITSVNMKGFADFEDRAIDYDIFITMLHEQLKPYAAGIMFTSGISSAKYIIYLIIIVIAVLVLAGASVYSLTSGLFYLLAIKLSFMAFLLITSIGYMKRNRPRAYPAGDIPADMLPVKEK